VEELDQLSINTMRTLAIDAVNAANSGRTRYAPEKFP
jgi:transketolase